jgi:hypothetical protein
MASEIKSDKLSPSTGTALQIGDASDTITIPTGATFTITDGLGVAAGGTGLSSFTAGDVLYATGTTTLAKLAKGTAEQVLAMNSGATAPDWGSVDLTVLPTITVAKGGTNLTSFTAGDILYATGATTLAKLAKGTGSQTLKMNSGATAPEWATVAAASSDFVNLGNAAAVDAATLVVDGLYTSDYNVYKLFLTEFTQSADSSVDLYVRVNQAGSAQTDSNYLYAGGKAQRESGSGALNRAATGWNEARWSFTGEGVGVNYQAQAEITIHDPLGTNANKQVEFSLTYQRWDNGMYLHTTGGGFYRSTTASTGLTFYMSSGNITCAHWALYGLKAT